MSLEVFDLIELRRQTSGFTIHCLGTDGPSNFEQGFCSKVPLRVKGGELELPSEKEIDALDKNNDCCQDAWVQRKEWL